MLFLDMEQHHGYRDDCLFVQTNSLLQTLLNLKVISKYNVISLYYTLFFHKFICIEFITEWVVVAPIYIQKLAQAAPIYIEACSIEIMDKGISNDINMYNVLYGTFLRQKLKEELQLSQLETFKGHDQELNGRNVH